MNDDFINKDYTFMKIYNKFCRTKEYLSFMRKSKSATYYFLRAAIIRESGMVKDNFLHPAHVKYRKYFLNGQLVSRYSVKDIAEYNGTSKAAISREIKELENDGFIKVIRINVNKNRTINYYQIGTWNGTWGHASYNESYYLDEHFDNLYDKHKSNRDKEKDDKRFIGIMPYFETFEDYWDYVSSDVGADKREYLEELWTKNRKL
jgi:predicted transcriptional regulator